MRILFVLALAAVILYCARRELWPPPPTLDDLRRARDAADAAWWAAWWAEREIGE